MVLLRLVTAKVAFRCRFIVTRLIRTASAVSVSTVALTELHTAQVSLGFLRRPGGGAEDADGHDHQPGSGDQHRVPTQRLESIARGILSDVLSGWYREASFLMFSGIAAGVHRSCVQ